MTFGSAHYSNLFWVIAALIVFFIWALKRKRALLERFASGGLLEHIAKAYAPELERLKIFITLAAACLLVVSLMQPRWGFHWQEIKSVGADIIIAIDTSKSMLAEDVRPNRLERSKLAVKDLIKELKGDRIGLIAFAGSSFLQCPVTLDYNGFMLALDDLKADTIPQGGTSLSSVIDTAIKAFRDASEDKALMILTDGEDHIGGVEGAVARAKDKGIKIFTVGIGTKEGELIPVTDEGGRKVFLKDREGNVVKSRLDEDTLKEMALSTGGSYIHARGAEFGLETLYSERLSRLKKAEFDSKLAKRYDERFQIPLAFALILIALEPLIPRRRRDV
ncbi:MAG: hypothetical protein AUJ75_00420 [Candidatus Omnitrophica bacterium CG1_02_49_10]|nr:MAG: hypothetical protein AUJ75_00420 [Candidatus Omnitrophica bacterium CG1_02_49_10]